MGAALALAAGCGGGGKAERGEGNVVWLDHGAGVDAARLEALRRAGVREVVVEAGALAWEGGRPRVAGSVPRASVRLPAVLAVEGSWQAPAGTGGDLGEALAGELRRVGFAAAAVGWRPVGFLLDLEPPAGEDGLRDYGKALERVRRMEDGERFVAVALDRRALAAPGAEAVVAAADLVVAFLYGPRSGVGPGPRGAQAWSLAGLEADLARLDALGTPYLLGVGTVGTLTRGDGTAEDDTTTVARLSRLLAVRGLRYEPPPLFEVRDHQIYPFRAERALSVGGWALAAGEAVVVRRLAPHHLRILGERVAAAAPRFYRGLLLDRLPREGEDLALTAEELAAAADPAAGGPRLELTVEPARSRRNAMAVTLSHRGGSATELALLDGNYVEVRLDGGSFGHVEPGGFRRYELMRGGRRAADMRSLTEADALRLYVPFLEAGELVASGPIEVRGRAEVSGRLLLPDGEVVVLAVQGWPPEAAPR